MPWKRLPSIFGLLVILAMYTRLFFGVEITDEAYYVACANLASIGGSPYLNDMYFQQNASIVFEPMVYLYHWLFGTTGIILFVRHLYFLLALSTAWAFYRVLRTEIRGDVAFSLSLIPVSFVLSSVPSLSYNTIGSLGFGLGAALTLYSAAIERSRASEILGAFFFSLSMFAYPTFFVGIGIFYLGLMIWERESTGRIHWGLVGSAALAGLLVTTYFLALVARVGTEALINSYQITVAYGAMGSAEEKFKMALSLFQTYCPSLWITSGIFFVGVGLVFKFPSLWFLTFPIFTLIYAWNSFYDGPPPSHIFLTCLAGLSVPAIRFYKQRSFFAFPFLILAMAAIVQAVTVTWTSGNSAWNSPLASQFAVIALFAVALSTGRVAAGKIALVIIHLALVSWTFNYMYRDDHIVKLRSMMTSGPWAGLITTESRKRLMTQIGEDLSQATQDGSSILFYDSFPGGYLYSNLYPQTISVFIHPLPYGGRIRHRYAEYYRWSDHFPDIIFQMESFPFTEGTTEWFRNQWTQPPYDLFFDQLPNTGQYDLITQRNHYKIWRRKGIK